MEWSTAFDQNGWLEYPENSACNFQAGTKVTSSTVLLLQELLFNATLRLTQGFKCPMLTPWVSASAISVSLAVPGMVWLAAMVSARAHSCAPWRNVMVRGTQVDLFPKNQQLFVGCGAFAAIFLAFFPIPCRTQGPVLSAMAFPIYEFVNKDHHDCRPKLYWWCHGVIFLNKEWLVSRWKDC